MEVCWGGWTTLASSDSVGHAYLFDILRSEMRFFFPETELPISLSLFVFQFSLFPRLSRSSLLSMKLATNYGSWPLEKILPLKKKYPTFEERKKFSLIGSSWASVQPRSCFFDVQTTILKTINWTLSFFPSSFLF